MTTNRVAVVTGGSRGIGKAICLELSKRGFDIVVCSSSKRSAIKEVAEECEKEGIRAVSAVCDVSSEEQVLGLFELIKEEFGRVDVLINNAGIVRDGLILKMSETDFDLVIDVNLKGAFLCSREAAKLMLKAKYGRIINISSVSGISGNAGQANYSASKAGLIGFTKSLAKELGAKGITVNAIAPGFIETDMTGALSEEVKASWTKNIPRRRAGKPSDVAVAAAFFASEEADYITGQVLNVDGGML